MRNRLSGQRVLVTGGAGGVGRETAARMLDAGAKVVSADIPGADRHAESTITFAGDLARQDELERLFALVDDELGGLDILVACAGLPADSLMNISDAGWRQVIDANLVSYVGCAKKAIERIRESGRKEGQVILVGSISVHIKAVGESVYNASKGGVALFAETLRKEMIPEKIRVTLIEPGAIATHLQPFSDRRLQEFEEKLEMLPAGEVAEGILFAATRPPGVDVVTLRIEPLVQKSSSKARKSAREARFEFGISNRQAGSQRGGEGTGSLPPGWLFAVCGNVCQSVRTGRVDPKPRLLGFQSLT